jgi:hypothetical protein
MSEYTYHVIGKSGDYELNGLNDAAFSIYGCMTRIEMLQALNKAEKVGHPIIEWVAQTATGAIMLGNAATASPYALLNRVKFPELVECPVCFGEGCVVCNYSGITEKDNWLKWLPWQLDQIRKDLIKVTAEEVVKRLDN